MSLAQYIARKNIMNAFFKEPLLEEEKLDDAMAQELFQSLDTDMSPECLTADGERSRAEVARLRKLYTGAYKDLVKKGFSPAEEMFSF